MDATVIIGPKVFWILFFSHSLFYSWILLKKKRVRKNKFCVRPNTVLSEKWSLGYYFRITGLSVCNGQGSFFRNYLAPQICTFVLNGVVSFCSTFCANSLQLFSCLASVTMQPQSQRPNFWFLDMMVHLTYSTYLVYLNDASWYCKIQIGLKSWFQSI